VHQNLSLEATGFGMKQKFKGDWHLDSLDKTLEWKQINETHTMREFIMTTLKWLCDLRLQSWYHLEHWSSLWNCEEEKWTATPFSITYKYVHMEERTEHRKVSICFASNLNSFVRALLALKQSFEVQAAWNSMIPWSSPDRSCFGHLPWPAHHFGF